MENKGNGFLSFLGGLFLFILIVGTIFELALVLIAYHYADRVKCNLIWCEFTFKDNIGETTNITSSEVCYLNNVQVNCSNIDLSDERLGINWSSITSDEDFYVNNVLVNGTDVENAIDDINININHSTT